VLPAAQRIDADDQARGDVDLRLVVQQQLVVLDRPAQLARQGEALDGVAVLLVS
jgi:hypothetical protein